MVSRKLMAGALALVLLLMPLAGCAAEKELQAELSPCSVELVYIDPVFVGSYADPKLLTKEAKISVIDVGLKVSNPNEVTVTLTALSPELTVNGTIWGMRSISGDVYIPPGKEIALSFPFTINTFMLVQQTALLGDKSIPEAVGAVLGTLAAISKSEAKYEVNGSIGVSSEIGTLSQNFDFNR